LVAVALVEEGVRLREAGFEAPILVLSEPVTTDAAEIVRWGLTPCAYRTEFIRALASVATEPLDVHLKIDTGMHRVGAPPGALRGLVDAVVTSSQLRLGGVWTHFAVADEDPE